MNKFERFDDLIAVKIAHIAKHNRVLFIILFPLILIGDIILIIPRKINTMIMNRREKKREKIQNNPKRKGKN